MTTPKQTGQFSLASESVTVLFTVTSQAVTVTTKSGHGAFPWLITRLTMTLEQARAKYRTLLKSGYKPW